MTATRSRAALGGQAPGVATPDSSSSGHSVLPPLTLAGVRVEARTDDRNLWIVVDGGGGALAVRAAWSPEGNLNVTQAESAHDRWTIDVASPMGPFRCVVEWPDGANPTIHVTTHLIPTEDAHVRSWPRDLIAFLPGDGGSDTEGTIHATQRGPRTGVVYGTMTSPVRMRFLYLQHFTSLNACFTDTHTTPIDAVGGEWPLMGFRLPESNQRCKRRATTRSATPISPSSPTAAPRHAPRRRPIWT